MSQLRAPVMMKMMMMMVMFMMMSEEADDEDVDNEEQDDGVASTDSNGLMWEFRRVGDRPSQTHTHTHTYKHTNTLDRSILLSLRIPPFERRSYNKTSVSPLCSDPRSGPGWGLFSSARCPNLPEPELNLSFEKLPSKSMCVCVSM